jgi:hypothetical protein
MSDNADWPAIPFEPWKDSCSALHLQTQIVGKYRLAHTPWVNHSWHATLYVNADGLTTGLVPDGAGVTVAARPWDADAISRFHRALARIDAVFNEFRTGFLGKVSPVHLFWGSFDLAVTRFSGKSAPLHPGGIPNLPDAVTREAYSHEVSSAGFWPGGGGIDEPCFYSYAYPTPEGFAEQPVGPPSATFDKRLGEFLLPYEAVRSAPSPREALLEFLGSTFDAAAGLAGWDKDMTCAIGRKGVPRLLR